MDPISVCIVSDVRLHREGLARLLIDCPSITVMGAHSVREALDSLPTSKTDIALIDAPLRGYLAAIDAIRCVRSTLLVVAVGIGETAADRLSCAAAGADGYVRVDATVGDMVATVQRVMSAGLHRSASVAASLAPVDRRASAPRLNLTHRELRVAELLNRGCANKEIARRLCIEPCTAKNHVRNIMMKLNVHRRGEAAAKLRTLIGETTPIEG